MVMKIEKTEAYAAEDGSLHPTEEAAKRKSLEIDLYVFFDRCDEQGERATTPWSMRKRIVDNFDEFWELVNAYKGY